MTKKQLSLVALLMAVSVGLGALVATDWGRTPLGVAGPDVRLGAAAAPVKPAPEVQTLNDAFVAVSNAVTPQVVSLTVTSRVANASEEEYEEDEFNGDPLELFRRRFQMPDDMPQRGSGSGVIISPDGYILTNNHVVAPGVGGTIRVQLNDGREFDGQVIGRDSLTDLAVVKIDAGNLPTASFGNSDEVQVGGLVLAVGNPLGLNYTVTQGIVSALGRGQLNLNMNADGYGIEDFIQTDAAINPGNSGGGLFDLRGQLIGINSAIATRTGYYQGYGFAIPINLARAVAEDLIEDGSVNRGYIGVKIKNIDSKLARGLGLPQGQGVLVSEIVKGGAGEAAGLRNNDVILEVDGQKVNTSNHLQSMVARRRAGQEVNLKVFRDGSTFERTVRLKAPSELEAVASSSTSRERPRPQSDVAGPGVKIPQVGMTIEELDPRTKRDRKVESGVKVGEVARFGEAYNSGIQSGDVIERLNRKPVSTPEEAGKVFESAKSGDVVLVQLRRRNGTTDLVAVEMK